MDYELSARLADIRKEHKLSQESLAEKLGLSRQAISKWERGESAPDTSNLIALAKIYGVSLDELLGHTPESVSNDDLYEEALPEPKVKETAEPIEAKENTADENTVASKPKKGKKAKKEKAPKLYPKIYSVLTKIPVAVIVPIIYVVCGMLKGVWHPWWIMILTVPIYYLVCFAFSARNTRSLFMRMPIFLTTVFIFLVFGFFFSMWKYAWLVFLFNPLYYWIAFSIKKNN